MATAFPDHLSDAAATPKGFAFWNDFITQDATDATVDGPATFTAVSSGTLATASKNGGWARIANADDTDDSGGQLQPLAAFYPTTGKRMTFKTRFQFAQDADSLAGTGVATESFAVFGFYGVDTSVITGEATDTDGIYFIKREGSTALNLEVKSNSATETYIAAAPSVTGTGNFACDLSVHTLGISVYPNGTNSSVRFFIDGKLAASATGISIPASTIGLTPTVAFTSGDGVGFKYCDIDYVGAWQDR